MNLLKALAGESTEDANETQSVNESGTQPEPEVETAPVESFPVQSAPAGLPPAHREPTERPKRGIFSFLKGMRGTTRPSSQRTPMQSRGQTHSGLRTGGQPPQQRRLGPMPLQPQNQPSRMMQHRSMARRQGNPQQAMSGFMPQGFAHPPHPHHIVAMPTPAARQRPMSRVAPGSIPAAFPPQFAQPQRHRVPPFGAPGHRSVPRQRPPRF